MTTRRILSLCTILITLALSCSLSFAGKGELTAIPAPPNPNGAFDQLFLLQGDGLGMPVEQITPAQGASLPAKTRSSGVLHLFHINDLHNHLTIPHAKKGSTHKFSQMAQIIEQRRTSVNDSEPVLFFSAGDDHTGSIFDELVGWSPEEYVTDPAYTVYSAAGVDAAALGNHELDRGASVLHTAIQDAATFPVLSANVYGSKYIESGRDYYPAAIGVVDGFRIGLVGLTTPIDTHTGTAEDPGLAVGSPSQAVRNILPALSKHVDVILILSHVGFGFEQDRSGKAGANRTLGEGDSIIAKAAAESSSVPVTIIGGHTHTVLNPEGTEDRAYVDGVTILQAGGHGSHLGEATLTLNNGELTVQPMLHVIKKRDDRVARDEEKYASLEHEGDYDAAFENEHIGPLLAKLEDTLDAVIGRVESNPDVAKDSVVAHRYVGEMALANYMNDALVARSAAFPGGPVDIALFNATGFANGIPTSGELTFKEWYEVMPFADSVVILNMSGAEILKMLRSNAKRIVRPEELASGDVDLAGYVSRGFLHFSKGLRYTILLGDSAKDVRVTDVTIHGRPIEEVLDKSFRVAANSYVAGGAYGEAWNGKTIGAGVPGQVIGYDLTALPRNDTGLVYRNEVIAHIREMGVISPKTGAALDGRLTVHQ